MLPHGQRVIHIGNLRHIGKTPLCLQISGVLTLNEHLPRKPQQPGNALDHRGLSRAVRAQQDTYLARRHHKAHLIRRKGLAVFL